MEKSVDSFARVIKLFRDEKPKFTIDDTVADFENRPPLQLYFPKVQYDPLFQHYGLQQMDFREKIVNLTNPSALEFQGNENLHLNWITSVDILAARAGYILSDSFFTLAAIGIVKTKDNQILVGIRGGEITPERKDWFASGLYGILPGGSVKFKKEYQGDPITDTIMEEFLEEVGYFEITSQEVLGVFESFKPGPTGIKFVSYLTTDASLEQIQKANREAYQIYEFLLGKGATKSEISKELKNKRLPSDAWEHSIILGILDNSTYIKRFMETQFRSFSGIGAGALLLYTKHLEIKS